MYGADPWIVSSLFCGVLHVFSLLIFMALFGAATCKLVSEKKIQWKCTRLDNHKITLQDSTQRNGLRLFASGKAAMCMKVSTNSLYRDLKFSVLKYQDVVVVYAKVDQIFIMNLQVKQPYYLHKLNLWTLIYEPEIFEMSASDDKRYVRVIG